MKNYSFERVYGGEDGESVEIHGKNHGFRLGTKLFCLLLAFVFWLVVTNVHMASENKGGENNPAPLAEDVA